MLFLSVPTHDSRPVISETFEYLIRANTNLPIIMHDHGWCQSCASKPAVQLRSRLGFVGQRSLPSQDSLLCFEFLSFSTSLLPNRAKGRSVCFQPKEGLVIQAQDGLNLPSVVKKPRPLGTNKAQNYSPELCVPILLTGA